MLLLKSLKAAVIGGCILIMTAITSNAQSANGDKAVKSYPWTVTCAFPAGTDKLACNMNQTMFHKQTRQTVISAAIGKAPKDHVMRLTLPHGLNLTKGGALYIDKKKSADFKILTADQNGSYGDIALDAKKISAMKRGNMFAIHLVASSGQPIVFQLSLNGFAAAFEKL